METESTTVRISKESKETVDALRESILYYGRDKAITAIQRRIGKNCSFIYGGDLSNDAVINAALHIMSHIFNDEGLLRTPVRNVKDGEMLNAPPK